MISPGSLPNGTVGSSDEHAPYEPVEKYRADIDAAERASNARDEREPMNITNSVRCALARHDAGYAWEVDSEDVAKLLAAYDRLAAPNDGAREALVSAGCTSRDGRFVSAPMHQVIAALTPSSSGGDPVQRATEQSPLEGA